MDVKYSFLFWISCSPFHSVFCLLWIHAENVRIKKGKRREKKGFFLLCCHFCHTTSRFSQFSKHKTNFLLDKIMLSPLQTSATMVKIFNFQNSNYFYGLFRLMIEHFEPIYVIIQHGISMKVHQDHQWIILIYHPVVMEINFSIVAYIFPLKWGKEIIRLNIK